MRRNLGWRFALIGTVVLLAVWYIYPTIKWAALDKSERKRLTDQYRRHDAEHPRPELVDEIKTYLYRWYSGDKAKAV
ncbi:MAG: hypothetical protein JSV16_16795, partial [Candidatus Hydrogenedentota bacterium]